MNFTTIIISFCLLVASHVLMLFIGWHMGTKTDHNILMSNQTKQKEVEPYIDGPDVGDEVTLNTE